mmetsp:Transcript_89339/g.177622  ORF Transcript_89339/g.177622 Transcript_89339/m.177622 type:complete len:353 (+) Transcript_89339:2-1060(+)
MVDSTQALALSALDASVAAADAAKVVQAIVRHNAPITTEAETAEGSGESAPSDEAAADNGEKEEAEEENLGEEEDEQSEKDEEEEDGSSSSDESYNPDSEAWRSFETRWSLSTLLEAVRMLRVTNRELKHAQKAARELGEREKRAKPSLTADHRKRAFALLMEFFDEASVRFHELLQVAVHNASGDDSAELGGSWVTSAVERSFGFLLRCRPELAVSLDPRAQTLRAALAIDAAAVNQVVQVEVSRRLQNSLMLVILDAKVAHAAVDGAENTWRVDEAAALQALEESKVTLAQALVHLEAALSGASYPAAAGSATAGDGANECASPTGPPPPPPPPPPASPPPTADTVPPPR